MSILNVLIHKILPGQTGSVGTSVVEVYNNKGAYLLIINVENGETFITIDNPYTVAPFTRKLVNTDTLRTLVYIAISGSAIPGSIPLELMEVALILKGLSPEQLNNVHEAITY